MEWSDSDIKFMKSRFLQGHQIKQIAHQMGRSASSINKALSRFGVRQEHHKPKKKILRRKHKDVHHFRNRKKSLIACIKENWVEFMDIVNWLGENDFPIYPIGQAHFDHAYMANGKFLTKNQIVLLANKLRVEQGLPVFFVHEVTNA